MHDVGLVICNVNYFLAIKYSHANHNNQFHNLKTGYPRNLLKIYKQSLSFYIYS